MPRKINTEILFLALPIFVLFLIFLVKFKYAWWGSDDVCFLLGIDKVGFLKLILYKSLWRKYVSPVNFTPFLIIEFGLDNLIFKLNPTGYYVHLFLVDALAIIIMLLFFKKIFNIPIYTSAIFLLCFILSRSFITVFSSLNTRHYITGLFFLIIAFYLFRSHFLLSLIFYFLACMCKEIYILYFPVFIILYLWYENKLIISKELLLLIIPGVLFALWRFYITGLSIYPFVPKPTWNFILNLPKYIYGQLSLIIFILLMLLIISSSIENPKFFVFGILLSVSSIMPFLPVITLNQSRYYFPILLIFYFLGIYSISSLKLNKKFSYVIHCLIIFAFVTHSMKKIPTYNKTTRSIYIEGKFYIENPRKFLHPRVLLPWYFYCSDRLYKTPTHYCSDLCFCGKLFNLHEIWEYNRNSGRIVKVNFEEICNNHLNASIFLDLKHNTLKWKFGQPRKNGEYKVYLIYSDLHYKQYKLKLPAGSYKLSNPVVDEIKRVRFYIEFVSKAGDIYNTDILYPSLDKNNIVWVKK